MKKLTKKLLLDSIVDKQRVLTDSEAFDFYTEHVMKNQVSCKFTGIANYGRGRFSDYDIKELEFKAKQWHKLTLGSLILSGTIGLGWVNEND